MYRSRVFTMLLLLLPCAGAQNAPPDGTPATPVDWTVPSNETIQSLLADRVDRQRQDVGIVVGVVEPAGRRVIGYGERGTGDDRPLDGDTVFWVGSVTKVFTTISCLRTWPSAASLRWMTSC